jgi:hypothetical protein
LQLGLEGATVGRGKRAILANPAATTVSRWKQLYVAAAQGQFAFASLSPPLKISSLSHRDRFKLHINHGRLFKRYLPCDA